MAEIGDRPIEHVAMSCMFIHFDKEKSRTYHEQWIHQRFLLSLSDSNAVLRNMPDTAAERGIAWQLAF